MGKVHEMTHLMDQHLGDEIAPSFGRRCLETGGAQEERADTAITRHQLPVDASVKAWRNPRENHVGCTR
jgi:hypothetical protein